MEKQDVEPTADGRGGHDPGRDREAEGHHLPDLPGEGGGERGGEEPHGEPGAAARGGPVRCDLEAVERAEEQGQVQVGDDDEGDRAVAVAVDAADAEREVERQEDEDRHGGPTDAAGGGRRRRGRGFGFLVGIVGVGELRRIRHRAARWSIRSVELGIGLGLLRRSQVKSYREISVKFQ